MLHALILKLTNIFGPIKVKRINTGVERNIDHEVKRIIYKYFKFFNNDKKNLQFQSDNMIKEVFSATFNEACDIAIDKMKNRLMNRKGITWDLLKYEITYYEKEEGKVLIGINRHFKSGEQSMVYYHIENIDGQWKFNHIIRLFTGKIAEKYETNSHTLYRVNNGDNAFYFRDAKRIYQAEIDDFVEITAYLNVNELLDDCFMYEVNTMRVVSKEIA